MKKELIDLENIIMREVRTYLFLEQDLYNYLNKIFPTNKEFDKFLLELYKVVRNKIYKSDLTTRSLNVLQKYHPKLTSKDLKNFLTIKKWF